MLSSVFVPHACLLVGLMTFETFCISNRDATNENGSNIEQEYSLFHVADDEHFWK